MRSHQQENEWLSSMATRPVFCVHLQVPYRGAPQMLLYNKAMSSVRRVAFRGHCKLFQISRLQGKFEDLLVQLVKCTLWLPFCEMP